MVYIIQDKADFDRKVNEAGDKLVVINFFTESCEPCLMMSPKLDELAELYSKQAAVFKVDIDKCKDIAKEYGVTSVPTFLFIENKQVIDVFMDIDTEKLFEKMQKIVCKCDDVAAPVAFATLEVVNTTTDPASLETANKEMVYTIEDKEEFERKLNEAGDKLVMIDFFAEWCGACKMISVKVEELAAQYSEQAAIFKIDIDTCEDIAMEYAVETLPTFLFFKNKQVIDVLIGSNTDKLVEKMQKIICDCGEVAATDSTATAALAGSTPLNGVNTADPAALETGREEAKVAEEKEQALK